MAVHPPTPEVADDPGADSAAELAALRRRAYGPDADIHADAAARARLQELEDALRRPAARSAAPEATAPEATGSEATVPEATGSEPTPPAFEAEPAAGVTPRTADAGEPRREARPRPARMQDPQTAPDPGEDPEPVAAPDAAARRPDIRRRVGALLRDGRTWAIAAVGAVVGAAVAIGLLVYPWDAPDRVLRPQVDQPRFLSADYGDFLRQLGAKEDSQRAYEPVAGYIPWSLELESGGRCVLVTRGTRNLVNMACASDGRDPILDLLPGLWGGEQANTSTTLRFVGRDDRVEVWFGGRMPTSDSALRVPVS